MTNSKLLKAFSMEQLMYLELRRLSNGEAVTYISDVVRIIEQNTFASVSLNTVIGKLKGSLEQAKQGVPKFNMVALTESCTCANSFRQNSFLIFKGIVESALKSSNVEERSAGCLLVGAIRAHGWEMQSLPADKFSASLNALFTVLDDAIHGTAVNVVNADKALVSVKETHQKFEDLDKQRNVILTERNIISVSKALKYVAEDYQNVFKALEGLLLTSTDASLNDTIQKLNVLTDAKLQTIRSRATKPENLKKDSCKS